MSLTVATSTQQLPIDFALFLPESWTDDKERRAKAKVPDHVVFQTKHELALEMIYRAVEDQIPGDIVLADSFYGHSRPFREAIRALGFDYGMAIFATDRMHATEGEEPLGELRSAKEIAVSHGRFRECRWREGTKRWLTSRFAVMRVMVPDEDGFPPQLEWLVAEWPEGEDGPTKFILTTLPAKMAKKQIIRLVKKRFRTEQAYEEMKGDFRERAGGEGRIFAPTRFPEAPPAPELTANS